MVAESERLDVGEIESVNVNDSENEVDRLTDEVGSSEAVPVFVKELLPVLETVDVPVRESDACCETLSENVVDRETLLDCDFGSESDEETESVGSLVGETDSDADGVIESLPRECS
jgi:hypothetical protein